MKILTKELEPQAFHSPEPRAIYLQSTIPGSTISVSLTNYNLS